MSQPVPTYTEQNCTFSCPLQWGVSAFWREDAAGDDWLRELTGAVEPDGIRILSHRLSQPTVSQFFVSSRPEVAPLSIVQRIKGRLQHLLRSSRPKAWKGNYAVRSIGKVTRETVADYIRSQIGHHEFADPRFAERLRSYQIENPAIDLAQPQRTSHGLYWYNLHVVMVRRDRETAWQDTELRATREMIVAAAKAKGYLLSRAGILPDHVHLLLGCPIEESPQTIVLGYLNNLAFAVGMKAAFQFGAFVGTVGEYTNQAITHGGE